MFESLKGLKRTHRCGTLCEQDAGKSVTVMGFADTIRNLGGVVFIDLRDISGTLQLVFDSSDESLLEKASKVRTEFVLAVKGTIRLRSEETVNPKVSTGKVELVADELRILSKAQTTPFVIEDETNVKDELRLKYRYLDLRRPSMQQKLITRHKIAKIARDFFDENDFLEIETPILTKSSPEGARDYLVPSRVQPGKFYALPQSPQLYKQILMISGMDRYFQIARCFRDEDLRADRQPEFTQIDIEMSFIEPDDIMSLNEKLIQKIFKEIKNIDVEIPFKRLPYQEAMDRFGSDKPDTRFGLELCDISDAVKNCEFKVFKYALENGGSVRAINAKGLNDKMTRRNLDEMVEFVKIYKAQGLAWFRMNKDGIQSPVAKFLSDEEIADIVKITNAEEGDVIFVVADRDAIVYNALGALRLEIAKNFGLIDENKFNFLWVTEFPLFEYDEEEKRYVAKHHPFTSPMDEDIDLIETAPEKARAKAYDIILNGVELGGGSIRIYNSELQEKMFKALGFTKERAMENFGYLIEAFKYGTPPHGGMAYGLDRLVMLITGCDSIRDVIAFPKVQTASELMNGSPSYVEDKQLKELRIKPTIEKKD